MPKAVARGIEKQGNQVDTFDGARDANIKLTIYQYIVVGAEPVGTLRREDPGLREDIPRRGRSGDGKEELRLRFQGDLRRRQVTLPTLMKMHGRGGDADQDLRHPALRRRRRRRSASACT